MKKSVLMIMYGKSVGGAELQFMELANFLAEKNEVRLLIFGRGGNLQTSSLSNGIELKLYPYSNKLLLIKALFLALVGNIRLNVNAIVSTSFIGNMMGCLLGFITGTKTVSLQTVSTCMRRPMIDRFVLRRCRVLIAGATDIKDYLVSHLGPNQNIEVIHNWVDFSKRGVLPEADEIKAKLKIEKKLIIGCIGRLHPQKGQLYLIEAFAQLVGDIPDCVLLLVGDGDDRNKLEQKAEELGIYDKILFTGAVSGKVYNEMFSAIDIYVQPSIFEGLPRTLLDAMYYGKAIVASDINGNSEAIVSEENGILVPSGDVNSLMVAIKTLSEDVMKRCELGNAAKKCVYDNFEMRKQLTRIENILFQPHLNANDASLRHR